jgi:hypothetical protein
LRRPRWQEPELVVQWLGGVQAQDYNWAKWSVGLRARDAKEPDVQRAIAGRRVVRTWAFRGTLHLLAAADVSWVVPLLAPIIIAANARRYRQLELDEATFAQSNEVIRHALEGEGSLVRAEIARTLERAGISAEGQRAPYLLQRAALDGVICHGLPRGREPTYVLLSPWIGSSEDLNRGKTLTTLAGRYLSGHGPATVQDFAWWAGLSVAAARQALEAASSTVRVATEGKQLWAAQQEPPLPGQELPPLSGQQTAQLLPPFDDYLLGYRDRSWALDPAHAKRVNAGGGMPRPTIVLNGEVIGIWKRTIKGDRIIVTQELFRGLDETESTAVEGAARRYGDFYGVPVEIQSQKVVVD